MILFDLMIKPILSEIVVGFGVMAVLVSGWLGIWMLKLRHPMSLPIALTILGGAIASITTLVFAIYTVLGAYPAMNETHLAALRLTIFSSLTGTDLYLIWFIVKTVRAEGANGEQGNRDSFYANTIFGALTIMSVFASNLWLMMIAGLTKNTGAVMWAASGCIAAVALAFASYVAQASYTRADMKTGKFFHLGAVLAGVYSIIAFWIGVVTLAG